VAVAKLLLGDVLGGANTPLGSGQGALEQIAAAEAAMPLSYRREVAGIIEYENSLQARRLNPPPLVEPDHVARARRSAEVTAHYEEGGPITEAVREFKAHVAQRGAEHTSQPSGFPLLPGLR
jgi:hypothetical protein